LAMPRQKYDRQARDDTMPDRSGSLPPGAFNGLVADVLQPRQVVDAASADNAKHGIRHVCSQNISRAAREDRYPAHPDVRLYCDAIINHCSRTAKAFRFNGLVMAPPQNQPTA